MSGSMKSPDDLRIPVDPEGMKGIYRKYKRSKRFGVSGRSGRSRRDPGECQ